jgi:hypothetical protein
VPRAGLAVVLTGAATLASLPVRAGEPTEDRPWSLAWRTSIKASALVTRAPDAELLFPDRDGASSLWRVRVDPVARLGPRVTAAVSYEHRLSLSSQPSAFAGLDVLAQEAGAPYRVRQLDWPLSRSHGSSWRHEVDRAYLAVSVSRVNVTVGRQGIGWGRGVLFGAVDLFSPFAPLEADREWRRGVDAVRADVKIADRASLDVVGAFGERRDESAFATRFRGYAGKVDVELVTGWRARDVFAGMTSSAAVGDAEVHGEVALFRAPTALPGAGDRRVALKAVAGGSYRFGLGNGLLVHAEDHYSGFGAKDAAGIAALLADPAFRARYLRGDTQILQRHALAALASYEVSPELAFALQWLHGPVDGSGVVAPSATVTFGDKISLLASAYWPYGRAPQGTTVRSEYGAASRSGLLQVRVYP